MNNDRVTNIRTETRRANRARSIKATSNSMAKNLEGDSFVVEEDAQSILKMLDGVLVAKSNLAVITDDTNYLVLC